MTPPIAVVHWAYENGTEGHGSPLPLDQAISMQRVYTERYRDRRYWLVPVVVSADGGR